MRWLLLLGILAVATVAKAEKEVLKYEELNLLDNKDSIIDLAYMLEHLFEFSGAKEEGVAEQKAIVEPEHQARYNKFIDTFFRRLNADARNTIDPLSTSLTPQKKKKPGEKKGRRIDTKAKNDTKGKKKDTKGKKKKGGNKKSKNNKKKNKNNKKIGRHPKNLGLDEVEGEDEDEEEVEVAEEEVSHIVKRNAEQVEEIEEDEDEVVALERQERSLDSVDEEEADDSEVAVSRSRKPNSKKSMTKRSANKNNNKNKGKSHKKNSGSRTSRASVSGIASLTCIGDVSVVDSKNGKELHTDFTIGPVNLKVNRKFGRGKDVVVRSASAYSPQLNGKMHLSVAANGRAKITKFNILRPSVVTTSGSLNKPGGRLGNNNFMKKSIGRIVPRAAKKLKLVARDVLQATESMK